MSNHERTTPLSPGAESASDASTSIIIKTVITLVIGGGLYLLIDKM